MKKVNEYTVVDANLELVHKFPVNAMAGSIISLLLDPPKRETLLEEKKEFKLSEPASKAMVLRNFEIGPRIALVVAVGEGRTLRDENEKMEVKPCDIVFIGTGNYNWFVYEGIAYTVMSKANIIGYISSKSEAYKKYMDMSLFNDTK